MIDSDLRSAVQELADRHAIEACLKRYGRGLDRRDIDLVRSAFHPDATDHHGPGMEYHPAAEALLADWGRRDVDRTFSQHLIFNTQIDLRGDTAHAESYFQVIFGLAQHGGTDGPVARIVGGRYADRFDRREGVWRIARRVVVTEFSASLEETALPHLLSWSRRDQSDPTYARPLMGPPPG